MTGRRSNPSDRRSFSRPIDVGDVPEEGLALRIEATPDERVAIAKETDLAAVGSLVVDYEIQRRSRARFFVRGELKAWITQVCVVTLEPFESEKIQEIAVIFAPPVATSPEAKTLSRRWPAQEGVETAVPVGGDEDPPDSIVDGKIDLGTVALEFLTLAQDLYPRKAGVQFTDLVEGEATGESHSAFAALGRLKDRL